MIARYHHTGSVNPDWLRAVRELESDQDFPRHPVLSHENAGTAIDGPMAPAGEPLHREPAGGPSIDYRLSTEQLFHADGRDLSDRTLDERVDALEQFRAEARQEFPNITLSQMEALEVA